MKIVSIASGSKGNCTYITSGSTHILVDVGVSFDVLSSSLSSIGENVNLLDAILITHEHIDHIKGLSTLIKKVPTIAVYAHPSTMSRLVQKIHIPFGNQNLITQTEFFIKDFLVSAFSLSHDASHCLGYSFFENGNKFSIATDTGYVSETLMRNLEGSSLIFIESNYEPDMLYYCDKYPNILKERISSKYGHLSNYECAGVIEKLIKSGTYRFALAHISENTNTYDIALKTTLEHLTNMDLMNDNIDITVLMQGSISAIYEV